jgi:putative sporulation protein YtaF
LENLHLFPILLLAVSTNLDNFGVGFVYGVRHICVPFKANVFIAFVNASGTLVTMLIGERLYNFMQPGTATFIGSGLFVIAGCWLIIADVGRRLKKKLKMGVSANNRGLSQTAQTVEIITMGKPVTFGLYCVSNITAREGILLSLALTFSNLVTGVGAALIGLDIVVTVTLVFIFGVIALSLGAKAGGYTGGQWLGGLTDPAAGFLLILIGIYESVL